MAALSQLFVEFRASLDKFHDDLSNVSKEVRQFDRDLKPVTDRVKEFGDIATKAGIALTAAVTAPVLAIAGLGISFNAMQEQAQISFSGMLGSGEKAKTFLADLKDFAAKTPFEFPDLVRGAQRLLAMGFAANEIKPLLVAAGNAVANFGGGGPEIDRVTLALGQMQGRGRVATQEMNQLTEVGIRAWKILADGIPAAHGSEAALRSMVEKGLVPADEAIKLLMAGMNASGDAMGRQSATFNGLISTIKDESRFLAGDLTNGLFNALKGPATALADSLHVLREGMAGWSDSTKAGIVVVAGLAAAVGPLLLVAGQLALGFNQLFIFGGHLAIMFPGITASILALDLVVVASTAGVVAIGAAVGIAIGMFANWLLKISGLQQGFDRLLKAFVDNIPIIGRWVTGQTMIAEATAGTTKAQQQLIAEFAKHNVAVDASRLGDSKYLASLAELSKEWSHASTVVAAHTAVQSINTAAKKALIDTHDSWAAVLKAEDIETNKEIDALHRLELAYMYVADARERVVATMQMPISQDLGLNQIATKFGIPQIPLQPSGLPPNLDVPKIEPRKEWEEWRKEGQKAIDQVIGDMSHMFIDSIVHGKNFWDAFKSMGTNALAGIMDTVMTKILHSFLDPFSTALGHFIDSLTKSLTGFLTDLAGGLAKGIGTSAAGSAVSTAAGIGGTAASGGGGAASAVSGIASGASSFTPMGIISAGLNALGSIGVILQLKRLEGTMNAVEANTRFTYIELKDTMEQILWPSLPHLLPIRQELTMHTNQLDAIYNALAGGRPSQQASSASPAASEPGGLTITNNITINAAGGTDAVNLKTTILDTVDTAIMTGLGSYRERWTLAFKQSAGIVSTVPAG